MPKKQKTLVGIYTGSYNDTFWGTQPTDVAIIYPPMIGDAVGMSVTDRPYMKIDAITNSSITIKFSASNSVTVAYKGLVSMGGKQMKWFHHTESYLSSINVFCSPGAIAGDYCLVNDVGGFSNGYPTIKAINKDSITISYNATDTRTTVNFKEFKKDFIYRE